MSNIYKNISKDTWNRMKFSFDTKSKISETTLTENLFYMIHQHKINTNDNSIQIFEAKDEKSNGNDLEIYLEIEHGKYIFLAVQAKKLYTKKQKYTAMPHKVNKTYQIDLLLKYAQNKKGLALYLLYNYVPNCIKNYQENFGCTLTEAKCIKTLFYPKKNRWKIPTFNDLHNYPNKSMKYCYKHRWCLPHHYNLAIPWHFLGKKYILKYLPYYIYKNKLKIYELHEIIDKDNWILVEEYSKVTYQYSDKSDSINNNDIEPEKMFFKPKFKMVINIDEDNKN